MSPQSTSRSVRRLMSLAAALLLAALLAIPSSGVALAQAPPGDGIVPVSSTGLALVNSGRDFVERKKKGEFVARPIFDQEIETLYYAVRDADTGDWITTMYHVKARAKKLSEGWEYSWEYPALKEQPDLDPETPFLLVILASGDGDSGAFHAVIPVHQPGGLWGRVLGALDPSRWARAFARWMIEGVHGTLCGVVERASGSDADECSGG